MADKVLIIGQGGIGRALGDALECEVLSARTLLSGSDYALGKLPAETIIYAAGPAGERACCADPASAFAQHVVLLDRLVREWGAKQRTLILLGTLAPSVGYYSMLKRAAEQLVHRAEMLQRAPVIECGQIIGTTAPHHGVAAQFLMAARMSEPVRIVGSGMQRIRFTLFADLVVAIQTILADEHTDSDYAPVTPALRVLDVAQLCIQAVRDRFRTMAPIPVMHEGTTPPSYEAPDEASILMPGSVTSAVLVDWMGWLIRDPEAFADRVANYLDKGRS